MAVTTDKKIKYKGRFEIDKDYHKDPSFKVVRIALSEYFVNDIPIEKTIKSHKNIYDFCGRQKFKRGDWGEIHRIENYKKVIESQQKVTRYYVSTDGNTFLKQYQKGTSEFIHVGYKVTIFNKYVEKTMEDYNIDYSFYIRKCKRELEQIEDKQLQLF